MEYVICKDVHTAMRYIDGINAFRRWQFEAGLGAPPGDRRSGTASYRTLALPPDLSASLDASTELVPTPSQAAPSMPC